MLGTAASLQQQVEALLAVMPADSKAELERTYRRTKAAKPFTANEGVQTQAYHCQADVLFYGGQAGGGKTLLELGWAVNEAESGIKAAQIIDRLGQDSDSAFVTQVLPFRMFKPSDARFQDYYENNRGGPFCDTYIEPKLALLRQRFSKLQSGALNHV